MICYDNFKENGKQKTRNRGAGIQYRGADRNRGPTIQYRGADGRKILEGHHKALLSQLLCIRTAIKKEEAQLE